jgi:hypothetical protein
MNITTTINWHDASKYPPGGWYLVATDCARVHTAMYLNGWHQEGEHGMVPLSGVKLWAEIPESPLLRPTGKNEYPY